MPSHAEQDMARREVTRNTCTISGVGCIRHCTVSEKKARSEVVGIPTVDGGMLAVCSDSVQRLLLVTPTRTAHNY